MKEKELSIKEIQDIELELLKEITNLCDQLHLKYFLAYGTLLGAVRHKGFIPWDDDVDIMMPRNDYEKLLIWLKNNINDYPNLKVFNRNECADYPYMITRISDDRYTIVMENEKPYGMGVFIDIYPYDGLGNTRREALSFGLKCDRLSSLCYQATRKHFAKEITKTYLKTGIKFFAFIFAKILGKEYFQNQLEKLAGQKDFDSSKYVGCAVWLSGGESDIFLKEWFDETLEVPFEQYKFKIPKEYDKVLRNTYNDYMQLPPVEERIGHHFYKMYKR